MAAGLTERVNRFDQHCEQTQAIARQHISKETIT
jgi:hypothetical protein